MITKTAERAFIMAQIKEIDRTEFAKELDDILHSKGVKDGTFVVSLQADFYNCTVNVDKIRLMYVLELEDGCTDIHFASIGNNFTMEFTSILSVERGMDEGDKYPYIYRVRTTEGIVYIRIVLD